MTASIADPNLIVADELDNDVELFTAWIDIHEYERVTLFLKGVRTGAPGDLTFVVEVSMDPASKLNKTTPESGLVSGDYDKLIDKGGSGAPVSNIVMSGADGFRVVSFSPEDTIRTFRLGYKGETITDNTVTWTVDASYAGSARS